MVLFRKIKHVFLAIVGRRFHFFSTPKRSEKYVMQFDIERLDDRWTKFTIEGKSYLVEVGYVEKCLYSNLS
jgi:hypothetical protein